MLGAKEFKRRGAAASPLPGAPSRGRTWGSGSPALPLFPHRTTPGQAGIVRECELKKSVRVPQGHPISGTPKMEAASGSKRGGEPPERFAVSPNSRPRGKAGAGAGGRPACRRVLERTGSSRAGWSAPIPALLSGDPPPSASANARNSGQQRLSRAGPRAGAPQQPRAGLAWEGRGARGRSWPGAGAGMQPLLTAVNSPPLGPPSRGWRSTELKSICDRVRRRGDGPGDELGWGRRM